MCLPWFLAASGWVETFSLTSLYLSNLFLTYEIEDNSHTFSGTPALTSRGFVEEDFAKVADFFDTAVKLAVKIKAATKG